MEHRLEIETMGKIKVFGPQRANGEITISGSKNSALPILAATLLTDEKIILHNIPNLADVNTMIEILENAGKKITWDESSLIIERYSNMNSVLPYGPVRRMRASFNVLGPLTIRNGYAKVALPGGCSIGVRPVNFHLEGLKKLGIESQIEHGFTHSKFIGAPEKVHISLPFPSVGATEHLITTAVLLDGTETILTNCAQEPEIVDLCNFLISMGAKIEGHGTSNIKICGVKELYGTEYTIIPDRIEAGTYAILGAIMGEKVTLNNVIEEHIFSLLDIFEKIGINYTMKNNILTIEGISKLELSPVDIETATFPGFPTDLQPQLMVLLSLIPGRSSITENVFKTRFNHVDELNRMGAKIFVEGNTAIITGVTKLSGAPLEATDLRASAALLIASLIADGETIINNVDHIFRGYEKLFEKLEKLGLEIEYYE
ncbi:UDP-N-acetylglucosamine 1-carboxyvinyltransferase [Marinitoga aeolica]|uniref:UDP-N-acetylglucosamine 1-carboxyvinyltransferase n=2 Tax=Marinitoga aeolica TaxID=2809031 RepID=A0ABY8PPM8_9BACT|nr:UDP-N-acetylglucosamine 1-carboxyvinyltransferase [Marinitoga aeolica]WGS64593.1 UDP-N-acetylglucosamine 1-carboxyvinyltransferase [Marinitoga aeolica]